MKISIENIYFLPGYAWEKLAERDVGAVEAIDATSLADLFARVLASGTNHLLRTGFDRGYVPQRDWIGRLPGRICFQESINRGGIVAARLPCDCDEFSYDVTHNQILKATMRQLVRTRELATASSEQRVSLCRRLSEVRDIELTGRIFGQVQLHRNNQFYDFLLTVGELIFRNLLISGRRLAAINLNQPWHTIHQDLLALVS